MKTHGRWDRMARQGKNKRSESLDEKASCCRVESLISVDERGQMVLPKEVRERAGIRPGEKLAVVSWEQGGKVCCISLVKAAALTEMVQDLLGPMIEQAASSRSE
jgi:AbrB family looped-hinge helix DNA binding protein